MKKGYKHSVEVHNLEAPMEIVPLVSEILKPLSVIDLGCGLGTFLRCFKENGVETILGFDGPWVNKELLFNNIKEDEFIETDLENPKKIDEKFDLAISLEVAEHISNNSADKFVENLISYSKVILFAAAIPRQGGQNHVNEQWADYWVEKFAKHDFIFYDVLRPIFWNNEKIFPWYRQNMFIVAHKDFPINKQAFQEHYSSQILNYIHPDVYLPKMELFDKVWKGNYHILGYIELIFKRILRLLGLRRKK